MLKKVLTIAMIGTSLVSFARVNMFFRDAVLAMPDCGGHFFSWHTEGSDEVLYKSLHSGTTIEELVNYMHNDAEKVDEQQSLANGPFAGQCTANGWWPATEADLTAGPRYFRTCKPNVTGYAAKEDRPGVPVPVSGGPSSWADLGCTKAHTVLAFDYISNMTHTSNGAIMYQEFNGLLDIHSLSYQVSDKWNTAYAMVNLPDEWINGSTYLWITHNGWQNSGDEIVIRLKNLRLMTPEEAEAEASGASGDTPMSVTNGNSCFTADVDEDGNAIWVTADADPNGYNPVFFGSSMIPNVPVDNTILAFDYKISADVPSLEIYVDKASAGVPTLVSAAAPGLTGIEDVFNPEAAYTSYQVDLAEAFATHEFARKFASNDRLWIGMKTSQPDSYLYLKNIRLTNGKGGSTSGIDEVGADKAGALKATGINGAIAVEAAGAFTVYNLAGVAVAAGEGVQTVEVEAGLYVVVADKAAQKVVVK